MKLVLRKDMALTLTTSIPAGRKCELESAGVGCVVLHFSDRTIRMSTKELGELLFDGTVDFIREVTRPAPCDECGGEHDAHGFNCQGK